MSGDYLLDRKGRPHHKCSGVEGWDDIYANPDETWTLSLDAGDGKAEIKFCPWCGVELKVTHGN